MDQFADRLARLAELSSDELTALEGELVSAFDQADQSGDVQLMQQLADALDQVRAAIASAGAGDAAAPGAAPGPGGAAAPAAPAPDQSQMAASGVEPGENEGEGSAEGEEGHDPLLPGQPATPTEPTEPAPAEPAPAEPVDQSTEEPAESQPEPQPEDQPTEPEPVPDGTEEENEEGTVDVTNSDVPAENQPVTASAAAPNYVIRAGGDIPSVTAGSVLADMDAVNEAMTRKVNSMRGVTGDGEYVVVASISRDTEDIDTEKQLRTGDPDGNSRKIRKFLKDAEYGTDAMVAAGWCAPKTPLYDIPGIGTTSTPVADSLPTFGVDRGGITWQPPPGIGSVNWSNFGRWVNTAAAGQPANFQFVAGISGTAGGAATKPCVDVPCGTEKSAELLAIPLCLCFDVLYSRANPEMIKANTDLVMVAQARFLEQYLLAAMFGDAAVTNTDGTGTIGTPDTPLGAARDFLVTLRAVVGQFRWRNRLAPDYGCRVYAPSWLRDAMAADLAIQIPGDDTLSLSYAEIQGYIADINVDVVWYIDDNPASTAATADITAASNFTTYLGWPAVAEWLVTIPGAFTRLDGGSLDLGVVRTKDDVQKNKYCEFSETFESVSYMGPSNTADAWAVRGTTPVRVRGGFAPAEASIAAGGVYAP